MTPAHIIAACATIYGVTPEGITGRSAARQFSEPRMVAAAIMLEHGMTTRSTAAALGRNVKTIYTAMRTASGHVENIPAFALVYRECFKECYRQLYGIGGADSSPIGGVGARKRETPESARHALANAMREVLPC